MRQSYLSTLANCRIEKGELTVRGLTSEEYAQLAQELRTAVVDYAIPHWKIVAIYIKLKGLDQFVDFVTKPRDVSKSYAEMIPILKEVVAVEGGGFAPGIPKEIKVFYKSVGDLSFIWGNENSINTYNGGILYSGTKDVVKFLKDVDIIETQSCSLFAIMYKGTGVVDFDKAQHIIKHFSDAFEGILDTNNTIAYCPMTAVYDLSQFFTIKRPSTSDTAIRLLYKSEIDETVLQEILRAYGTSLQEV